MQVFDGKRLPDNGRPLADSGVEDGSLLIMLHKRDPPPPRLQRVPSQPNATPADVERCIRAEADRRGTPVGASPPVQVSVRSVESQLQQLMQVRSLTLHIVLHRSTLRNALSLDALSLEMCGLIGNVCSNWKCAG
jgi:hypothetical protein